MEGDRAEEEEEEDIVVLPMLAVEGHDDHRGVRHCAGLHVAVGAAARASTDIPSTSTTGSSTRGLQQQGAEVPQKRGLRRVRQPFAAETETNTTTTKKGLRRTRDELADKMDALHGPSVPQPQRPRTTSTSTSTSSGSDGDGSNQNKGLRRSTEELAAKLDAVAALGQATATSATEDLQPLAPENHPNRLRLGRGALSSKLRRGSHQDSSCWHETGSIHNCRPSATSRRGSGTSTNSSDANGGLRRSTEQLTEKLNAIRGIVAALGQATATANAAQLQGEPQPTTAPQNNPKGLRKGRGALSSKLRVLRRGSSSHHPSDNERLSLHNNRRPSRRGLAKNRPLLNSCNASIGTGTSTSVDSGSPQEGEEHAESSGDITMPDLEEASPPTTAPDRHESHNDGLVEARLVNLTEELSSRENLQRARPSFTDNNNNHMTYKTTTKNRWNWAAGAGAIAVALVIALMIMMIGIYLSSSSKTIDSIHDATSSSNDFPHHPPNESPVTTDAAAIATAAPTTGSLARLHGDLPNHTRAKLQIFGTSQWKAWDWLYNHPNITHLPEWKKTQLFALACFFYAFEGEHWWQPIRERWMDDTKDECLWFSSGFGAFVEILDGKYFEYPHAYQIKPCNDAGEFTSLHLVGLQLGGMDNLKPSIPPEIALLTSLSILDLSGNGVERTLDEVLPISLDNNDNQKERTTTILQQLSSSLQNFGFGTNRLTGTIPSELALFTNLQLLWLPANLLTGTIPSELGSSMTHLLQLGLLANALTGPIPSEMGRMTALSRLALYNNSLSGTLCTELGSMTNLEFVHVQNNQFTGPISLTTELGAMTMLRELDFSNNALQGPIPSEMIVSIHDSQLEKLFLQNNRFTGTLPPELTTSIVTRTRLDGNQFTGLVPPHLCEALWCNCFPTKNVSSGPAVSTCQDLIEFPGFSGRYPPISFVDEEEASDDDDDYYDFGETTIVLNIIRTETSTTTNQTVEWVWQQQSTDNLSDDDASNNVSLLQEAHTTILDGLFDLSSYWLTAHDNTTYKVALSDKAADGVAGYVSVTTVNRSATMLHTTANVHFSEVTVSVAIGSDGGMANVTVSSYCDPKYEVCQ